MKFCRSLQIVYICSNQKTYNMKKLLITLLMSLSLMPLTLKADPIGTKVLIRLYYDVHRADLGKSSRSPIAPISVLQTDNVFTFPDHFAGETVEILSGDTVVYSAVVSEDGTIVVPDDIAGEYTLMLYVCDKVYSAEVTL